MKLDAKTVAALTLGGKRMQFTSTTSYPALAIG